MPERNGKSPSSSVQTPDETNNDSYKVRFDAETYRLAFLKFCGTNKDKNAIEKFREFANDLYQILPKNSATSEEPSNYVIVTRPEYKAAINTILDRREADSKERLDLERRADRLFRELRKSSSKTDKIIERIRIDALGFRGRSEFFINRDEEMTKPEVLQKKEGGKNPEQADISVERMPDPEPQQDLSTTGIPAPQNREEAAHAQFRESVKDWLVTKATPDDIKFFKGVIHQIEKRMPIEPREFYRHEKMGGDNLYWYKYHTDKDGVLKKKYVGKELPPEVDPSVVSVIPYKEPARKARRQKRA